MVKIFIKVSSKFNTIWFYDKFLAVFRTAYYFVLSGFLASHKIISHNFLDHGLSRRREYLSLSLCKFSVMTRLNCSAAVKHRVWKSLGIGTRDMAYGGSCASESDASTFSLLIPSRFQATFQDTTVHLKTRSEMGVLACKRKIRKGSPPSAHPSVLAYKTDVDFAPVFIAMASYTQITGVRLQIH